MKTPFVLLAIFSLLASGKRLIPIGGIFNSNDYESIIAFHSSINRVNMHERRFELRPILKNVTEWDSFVSEKIVCELISEGVAAIFGPSSIQATGITSAICHTMEVPHIITHWTPEPLGGHRTVGAMTLNVYPDSNVLSRALADLLVDYSWKSFTIIYETDEGLMRLKDVLQIHGPQDSPITVRQLGDEPDYRPLLKEIQTSGESNIVLDCEPDKILDILRQAREVKLMEDYQVVTDTI